MTRVSHRKLFSLKNYLLNLNFFEESSDDNEPVNERLQQSNIIATRVYLVMLFLILIFLGIYFSLSSEIIIITVQNPTEEQFHALPRDAQCLCSQISVPYGEFTSLQPTLHEVCSSDFVSDRWINALFTGSNVTYFSLRDFRGFATSQFQALSALCRLSIANIEQNIAAFNQNTFISSQLLSQAALNQQINSTIDQFQQTAPRTFAAQLEIIRRVFASNKLISGLQTNYIISYYDNPEVLSAGYVTRNGSYCNCLLDISCGADAVFDSVFEASTRYITGQTTLVPGITSGCLPMSSILTSTLECFYNQTCVDYLISHFSTSETFSAMILPNKTHYTSQATVQSIVENLMIEDWTTDISFSEYYDKCAPSSCSYSKEQRNDQLFVLTKLISLLSGVTLVLGLLIPLIVRFIIEKLNPGPPANIPKISVRARLQEGWIKAKKTVIELNIFKQEESNDRQIQYQRNATRVYLLLIIISVGIFAEYNLINTTLHRENIPDPSESAYQKLEKTYPSGVSCPCSLISISYSTFVTIKPEYHQLCSSYLISSTWIQYVYSGVANAIYILDFRFLANSHFQTLAMLCQQAKQTIDDNLAIFLQTQMVSSQVISQQSLESEIGARIDDWKLTLKSQFVRTIALILNTTLTNQLMNRLNIFFQSNVGGKKLIIEPRLYGTCNCAFDATCRTPMAIYQYDEQSNRYPVYTIPNFYLGCYLFDTLLLSTLECFYNESCMLGLDQFLDSSLRASLEFPALNDYHNSSTETIQMIVDDLMVVYWSSNISYTTYYSTCAPKSCRIEYNGRNTLFTVITIVLGISGGLSIGFKMLTLVILRLIEKLLNTNLALTISLHSIKRYLSCGDEKRMTNRFHFILVAITLAILYFSFTFSPRLVIVETKTPSLEVYERLAREHPDSLRCSCSQISIKYQSILNITTSFHPVCARNLIQELWIAYLLSNTDALGNLSRAYGYAGAAQVQGIGSVCKLCRDTVRDSVSQFLSSHMINTELFSSTVLSKRIQTTISDHRVTMPQLFINTFSLIREAMVTNKFMTTYSTNWIFSVPSDIAYGDVVHTVPVEYNGCNCGLSSECITDLSGVKIGCYIVEAMLRSTLECLYDQECIDKTHIVKPLNASVDLSRFPPNSTFRSVVDELMIENLTYDLSYVDYFSQCAPSSCIYSYVGKSNLIEGLTLLISLYGGLVIICRLIAVVLVKLLPCRSPRIESVPNEWHN